MIKRASPIRCRGRSVLPGERETHSKGAHELSKTDRLSQLGRRAWVCLTGVQLRGQRGDRNNRRPSKASHGGGRCLGSNIYGRQHGRRSW